MCFIVAVMASMASSSLKLLDKKPYKSKAESQALRFFAKTLGMHFARRKP
jgi:hypothetical protein